MKIYIQPTIQVIPVSTKDFLYQDAASPASGEPVVKGGGVVSGGGTSFNPGGAL